MPNDSALAAVRAAAQAASTTPGQPEANTGKQPAAANQPAAPAATPPAPAQPAASAEQLAAAKAEGQKEGAKAERQRLSAIMKLDAAKDRQPQALALALDTDVSAEQADAVLKATPAGGKANSFEAAMARIGNPDLGTNAAAGGGKPKPALDHAGIYERFNNPGAK